jgi:carotenoid cleavage dioxygenase
VFAPRSPDAAEDDGWIMTIVHDERSGKSALNIADARDFTGPPVARVHLPQRVPYGAHGNWIPDGTLR